MFCLLNSKNMIFPIITQGRSSTHTHHIFWSMNVCMCNHCASTPCSRLWIHEVSQPNNRVSLLNQWILNQNIIYSRWYTHAIKGQCKIVSKHFLKLKLIILPARNVCRLNCCHLHKISKKVLNLNGETIEWTF